MQRPAAQARVSRDDEPKRTPDPTDLLDGNRVGQGVQAGPTFILRDRDPKPAELADPPNDLARKAPLTLVLVDDRRDLPDHEVADRVAQQLVLGGEIQVHRRSLHRTASDRRRC